MQQDSPSTLGPLQSTKGIAERQAAENARAEAAARRSGLEGLTIRVALEDVREVLWGIPHDLIHSPRASLSDLFLKNDRLRGLGLVLILLATLSFVIL